MKNAITISKSYNELEKELKRSKILLSNSISYILNVSLYQYSEDDIYNLLIDIGMSPDEILNFIDKEGY